MIFTSPVDVALSSGGAIEGFVITGFGAAGRASSTPFPTRLRIAFDEAEADNQANRNEEFDVITN
jgi:hypothetical protein